jgi:hypothetical protein
MTLKAMRAQLNNLCRKNDEISGAVTYPKPITGLDKMQAELDENTKMWAELNEEKR